jgi:hypothetical protein
MLAVEPGSRSAKMKVELDIFSGRPNPAWVLSDADARAFLNKVEGLPRAAVRELSNPLGYRGFIVHVENGADNYRVQVQDGKVQLLRGRTTTYYSDPGRKLERWLLESGKPFLPNELFVLVEGELAR